MDNKIVLPPVSYIPAYGGYIRNGILIGYGAIRNNVTKTIQNGYFVNGVLDNSPIASTYTEWTSPPENVMLAVGNFIGGKAHGNMLIYIGTGPIYCDIGNNRSEITTRRRYIRANKYQQVCNAGAQVSESSSGTTVLMMDWINNNLLNILDIGDLSLGSGKYEVDDAVRVDSNQLVAPIKNTFDLSIYLK